MKILVINCGSSSIKYKLYDMASGVAIAAGGVEKIGLSGSFLKTKLPLAAMYPSPMPDHDSGMQAVLNELTDKDHGVIASLKEIDAIGNRLTHGGPSSESTVITDERLKEWEQYSHLAPIHNPPQFKAVAALRKLLPDTPQVGIFDTAFHQTIPAHAYMYALPYKYFEEDQVRRYGFHGTSFRFVLERMGKVLGFDPAAGSRIIICHIGNGISLAAVKDGKCIDTTLGMMPNEGPMMGTRSGDVDPSAMLYLMEKYDLAPNQMLDILNKQSGLLGVSGLTNDMREIVEAAEAGNSRARLAEDMYNYRLKKYIGAYSAVLGGLDYLVFTAGVGENQPPIRRGCTEGLEYLGIQIDEEKNKTVYGQETVISTPDSRVTVAVIPTDEELMMALDTARICGR